MCGTVPVDVNPDYYPDLLGIGRDRYRATFFVFGSLPFQSSFFVKFLLLYSLSSCPVSWGLGAHFEKCETVFGKDAHKNKAIGGRSDLIRTKRTLKAIEGQLFWKWE